VRADLTVVIWEGKSRGIFPIRSSLVKLMNARFPPVICSMPEVKKVFERTLDVALFPSVPGKLFSVPSLKRSS